MNERVGWITGRSKRAGGLTLLEELVLTAGDLEPENKSLGRAVQEMRKARIHWTNVRACPSMWTIRNHLIKGAH